MVEGGNLNMMCSNCKYFIRGAGEEYGPFFDGVIIKRSSLTKYLPISEGAKIANDPADKNTAVPQTDGVMTCELIFFHRGVLGVTKPDSICKHPGLFKART